MRNMKWLGILLLVFQPLAAFGQVAVEQHRDANDPRVNRELREKAVAQVGPVARNLVETYGEDAVAAIFTCSDATALKLAEFHAAGGLKKLPRSAALLAAIGDPKHGDDVAKFVTEHSQELADVKRFQVFLTDPLTYALALKSLDAGVVEQEERLEKTKREREIVQERRDMAIRQEQVNQWIGSGILLVFVLLAWRFRGRLFSGPM
jgi:hypothetical protein